MSADEASLALNETLIEVPVVVVAVIEPEDAGAVRSTVIVPDEEGDQERPVDDQGRVGGALQ
ncbi:MAG: hypothetical protein WCK58_16380, partial [Chloroflexota bacterium]